MNFTTKKITVAALMIAIVCIVTMFAKVPIPLGYANLGTSVLMLTVFFLGGEVGLLAAGIGSALSDLLLGYAEWVLPTLIIKTVMALILFAFIIVLRKNPTKIISVRVILGAILLNVWAVIGYVVAGAILYGSIAAGLGSGFGLIVEAGVNIVIFFVVGVILEKAGISKYIKM